jgi:hypothetical protein
MSKYDRNETVYIAQKGEYCEQKHSQETRYDKDMDQKAHRKSEENVTV